MASNIDIGSREIQLLIALQEQPLATYQELADKIGFSKSMVYQTLKRLRRKNAGQSIYFIQAQPHLRNLGLRVVEVFFECENLNKLKMIEKICVNHPYTLYRVRCYGRKNGLFVQFRIPKDSIHNISKLAKQIQDLGFTKSYEVLNLTSHSFYTTAKLSHWNPRSLQWTFEWKNWFNQISIDSSNNHTPQLENKIEKKINNDNIINSSSSTLEWLTQEDVAIIGELCKKARQKEVNIIRTLKKEKNIEFTPQTFSRHYRKIKENCIDQFRVFIDPRIFDLFNTLIIRGRSSSFIIEQLVALMKKEPIPFNSTFKCNEDSFFWYLQIPTSHLSNLIYLIQPLCSSFDYYYIDRLRGKHYVPWYKTFDEENHRWRDDEQFMVTNVLKRIKS